MGLTNHSMGRAAGEVDGVVKRREGDALVALAGNPNVGKSTLFNLLTGMHQHTGNWPGKTVGSAYGPCAMPGRAYTFVDIPGAYSLEARSAEEEAARDFLCFGRADVVVVVCDATCLRRNLLLALQILELTGRGLICVNLLDEAQRRGVQLDLAALSRRLGVPVVGLSAGRGQGVEDLLDALDAFVPGEPLTVDYGPEIEAALQPLTAALAGKTQSLPVRWAALRLLEDTAARPALLQKLGLQEDGAVLAALIQARAALGADFPLADTLVQTLTDLSTALCRDAVSEDADTRRERDVRLDKLLTGRITGPLIMLLGLAAVLWLTIAGANVPSEWLSKGLFWLVERLRALCAGAGAPEIVLGAVFDGMCRTVAWVVSVMLPPMAIFFPLFTLLEDLGYLPRVAFNLDGAFQKCAACGKQGLTMCMGLGCNAAGVVGCRIIDSPRERLIAMLTNALIPCNGRFPTLIALSTVFFAGAGGGALPALLVTGFILLGVGATFAVSWILSKTWLRGIPSSFTLELPPYRKPKIGDILLRSILDRTLFVLGRAVRVAAPAGLLIWALANLQIGEGSVLHACAAFLDPLGRLLGLDGVILLAFILGLPANEIVVPIMLMGYLSGSSLMDYGSLAELHAILAANGWTAVTAMCTLLFTVFHWPCSTTLLTVRKEAGGVKYMLAAAAIPTACGAALCLITAALGRL